MAPGPSSNTLLKKYVASLANFVVQYNFGCLSPALAFMTAARGVLPDKTNGLSADYPEPAWAKFALVGAVFAGSFVGMIALGYVGDVYGRRAGMIATLALVVLGSAASASASWGPPENVYKIICAARFLLGVGVGGIYPNAAATATEAAGEGEGAGGGGDDAGRARGEAFGVAKAFFWQTPGSLAPYVVALALTAVPPSDTSTSLQFRTLLGLGAVVALPVMAAAFFTAEADGGKARPAAAGGGAPAPGPFQVIAAHPEHLAALLGTGGAWFLYDVSFYGTNVFTPQILESIFGASDDLLAVAWQSLVVGLFGVPGVLAAMILVRPAPEEGAAEWDYSARGWLPAALDRRLCGWTARDLNVYGFAAQILTFGAMGAAYSVYGTGGAPQLKFAIFCAIQFSLSWGPNVGTYVQPTQSFPSSIRGTMHGVSAASGKLGAVVGTFMYGPLSAYAGVAVVMWTQVAFSAAGGLATYFLIPAAAAAGGAGGGAGGARAKGAGRAAVNSAGEDDDSAKSLLDDA